MAQESTSETRHGLSQAEARELCERILSFASADHTRVTIDSGWRGFTRTATNRVTTAGASRDVRARIMSVFGKRIASLTTNRMVAGDLKTAVEESEAMARLAPEDPEYLPELAQQEYAPVSGYYGSTSDMRPVERAQAAEIAVRAAREAGFVAAGYIDVRAGSTAIANSAGLFAFDSSTGVASTLTVRTPDGSSSGWAGDEAADWKEIESERIARDAVAKCRQWQGKTALDPGSYTVILEPTAAGMLMLRMRGAFNARQADEGRSYFSKPGGGTRVGEPLFHPQITIRSNPAAPNSETAAFDNSGLPRQPTAWIENGVLKNLADSQFWAQRQGRDPKPSPGNFILRGGGKSLQDLIRSTERGVLITRFWYIRGLNPRTISYTGLTRDGTFLIEKGEISRPVNNFRFNQSFAEMLQNVESLGVPTRVAAGENSSVGTPIVVPAMKVRNFNLASVSDAI